ncbi:MAG: hypothetical protein WKG07_38460 [Hymenobacter sp.]
MNKFLTLVFLGLLLAILRLSHLCHPPPVYPPRGTRPLRRRPTRHHAARQ